MKNQWTQDCKGTWSPKVVTKMRTHPGAIHTEDRLKNSRGRTTAYVLRFFLTENTLSVAATDLLGNAQKFSETIGSVPRSTCVTQQTAQANVRQHHAFEIVMACFDKHFKEANASLARLNL